MKNDIDVNPPWGDVQWDMKSLLGNFYYMVTICINKTHFGPCYLGSKGLQK